MNASVWFYTILAMGISASLTALVIMAIRLLFRKRFPKSMLCILWLVMVFQMLSPINVASVFSLEGLLPVRQVLVNQVAEGFGKNLIVTDTTNPQTTDLTNLSEKQLEEGNANGTGESAKGDTKDRQAESWRSQHMMTLLLVGWIVGAVTVLGRSVYLHLKLKKRWATATLFADKDALQEYLHLTGWDDSVLVYVTEQTESSFITGLLQPRIILPASLLKEKPEDVKWVLLHELSHLCRMDHFVKFLAFLGLVVHWFNPVLWIAFFLLERDMEMACDEKVLTLVQEREEERNGCHQQSYASSLLRMAVVSEGYARGALTFAESNVSKRIKNIMAFQQPRRGVKVFFVIMAMVLVLALLPQYSTDGQGVFLGGLGNSSNLTADSQLPGSILLMGVTDAGLMDTVMLVNQTSDGAIHIVQIPRDTKVPGLENLSPASQKINAFLSIKGRHKQQLDYLSQLWDIPLDYYVVVDMGMVQELVDMAGGVEYNVPVRMKYRDPYGNPPLMIDLEAGLQQLNGAQVEMLLRYRSGYMEGDLGRMAVHQDFLIAVCQQMDNLVSGLKVSDLVKIATKYQMDTNMSLTEIEQTCRKLIVDHNRLVFEEIELDSEEEAPYFVNLNDANLTEVFSRMELR